MKKFEINIECSTHGNNLTSAINAPESLNAMEVIQVLDIQSRLLKAALKVEVEASGILNEKKRIYRAKKLTLGDISKHTG